MPSWRAYGVATCLLWLIACAEAADLAEVAIATEESAAACAKGDEAEPHDACDVSFRQLRGEQHSGDVSSSSSRTLQVDDTVETAPLNPDQAEDCRVARHLCADFVSYATKAECAAFDDLCRVVETGRSDDPWACHPVEKRCTLGMDTFGMHDEDQEDEAVAEEDAVSAPDSQNVAILAQESAEWFQSEPEVMTLYHTTSKAAAQAIVESGFRAGHSGWCGGAIYFIDTPHLPASKYAPGITQSGAILEAQVYMGRVARMGTRCVNWRGRGWRGAKRAGFDSLRFDPGDGMEYVIWDPKQVKSIRIYEWS